MNRDPTEPIAAIDAGSNAIRFVAARASAAGSYERIESRREPLRLGRGAFRTGRIPDAAADAAVEVFGRFRARLDALGVVRYRAVATSAIRESGNGPLLAARARAEAGIRLEIIDGLEEARLVWTAVRHRFDPGEDQWLLADLGGGSLELSLVAGDRLLRVETHPIGTVRLLDRLGAAADERDRVRAMLQGLRLPQAPGSPEPPPLAGVVATGGNVEAIADLARAPRDGGVRRLTLRAIERVLDRLAAMSPEARTERLGLRPDRADVIVPAGVVYLSVAQRAGADSLLVPDVGVKEGVLLELAGATVAGARVAGDRGRG